MGRQVINIFTLKVDCPLVGLVKSKDDIKQGCLAAAVRSNQAINPAMIYVQAHPIDSVNTAKVLANFPYS